MITAFLTLFIAGALIGMIGLAISNILIFFPQIKRGMARHAVETPTVSVLIPARNEAAVIGDTLRALRAQDYPNFTITLLNDHSEDDTGAIARQIARSDNRLRVIDGAPLPDGWAGKNWACHQLGEAAPGDILLFTDADVRWQPGALTALIGHMQATGTDLITVWPTQATVTWSERLVVPLMLMVIIGYLPIVGTHHLPFAMFGAANGQCMAWRRDAYRQVGGHAAVADNVLEDVTLARMAKNQGLRLRMAEGGGLIGARMYHNWPEVRDGYAKNIIAGYGNSVIALLGATVFHWLVFILPWIWLITPGLGTWGLALVTLGLGFRALTAAYSGQRLQDAIFMPVSALLMTRIALRALVWHYTGGPRWKGRIIEHKRNETPSSWNKREPSSSAPASVD